MQHNAAVPRPEPLLTTPEVMAILGYKNKSSIARLVYERKLKPQQKLPGRNGAYLFRRSDVEQLRDDRAEAAS
jgi:predicted DNA-binding transcriptional regulator AlpA